VQKVSEAQQAEEGGNQMIHVEIEEIANGFTVSLFDSNGPEELDKTVFVESFEKAMQVINDWRNQGKEAANK